MKYYVYALLDPRKPGIYQFESYQFLFEPFYIGLSRRKYRFTEHLNPKVQKDKNTHKIYKIKKLKKLNFKKEDICHIVKSELSKKEAVALEIYLIKLIGRKDLNTGILVNHTNGGDGMYNPSKKERKQMGKKRSGKRNPFYKRKHSEETKQKIRETIGNSRKGILNNNYGKKWTKELKEYMSLNKKNAEYLRGNNNHAKRPEVRKKLSETKMGLKNPNASSWKLISPTGEEFVIEGGIKTNIKKYGIDYQTFKKDSDKKIRKNKKGWILIKL